MSPGGASGTHGPELLPILSELLNESLGDDDESSPAAAVMALDGIARLCKEGVIDLRTTLEVLSPKLQRDEGVASSESVSLAFLRLLELVPHFDLASDAYSSFRRETLASLWIRLTSAKTPTSLRKSVCSAIAYFRLGDHDLRSLPHSAKVDLRYPGDYVAPTEGPPPPPEDVLSYIPGSCWIMLLRGCDDQDLEGYAEVTT